LAKPINCCLSHSQSLLVCYWKWYSNITAPAGSWNGKRKNHPDSKTGQVRSNLKMKVKVYHNHIHNHWISITAWVSNQK